MNKSIKAAINFGIISGIITTIGVVIGLSEGEAGRNIILTGVLCVAFADAFSDALGIHLSVYGDENKPSMAIQSIVFTFTTKLIVASTFLIPILVLTVKAGMIVSGVWAVLLLSVLSYYLAVYEKINPAKALIKNLLVLALVILVSYYLATIL